MNYIDRGTKAAEFDFESPGAITLDSNPHLLDLSSIIPANAQEVHIMVGVMSTPALGFFFVRKEGNDNNNSIVRTQVATVQINAEFMVPVNAQEIEYMGDVTGAGLSVLGWLV